MAASVRRRHCGRARLAALVSLVAALVLAGGLTACRTGPKRLTVTTFVSGLDRPWDMAFNPAGSLFITEKAGQIVLRPSNSTTLRYLGAPGGLAPAGEGGLMGIAVDPSYLSNRRIYVCFRSSAPDVRVVRYRVNAASTGLEQRADIVTGIPTTSGRHNGCRIRFGPDGYLWVGTGDAAVPTVPQDPRSLGGKVLRVTTSGAGAPGNAPAPFDPRIYTYGHRNVQGLAFSPGGKAYAIEHGTYRDDEVNRLYAGVNYGWDPRPLSGSLFYDETRPMTDTARHPGSRPAVWRSGEPTIAPSGGTFLRGDQWVQWHGTLAMAVLKDQQLRVIGFDGSGNKVDSQWVGITDRGRLRSAVQGPDGNLYLAQDASPGAILKVTPSN